MKKTLFIISLIFAVFLASCSEKADPQTYLSSFKEEYTSNITVKENNTEYTARISNSADGVLDVVFAEPSVLWGMGYSFDGEDSYLIYNDMSIELNAERLEDLTSGGVYSWYELLQCKGEFTVSSATLNGEKAVRLTNGECEMYFDKEDASPIMIKTDDTVITFNDWNGKNTDVQTQDVLTN